MPTQTITSAGLITSGSSILTGSLSITGSFTSSLQQNHVWMGNASNRSTPVSASALTSIFPFSYGLFSQTANSTPVTATTTETTLINGGTGTLLVPANGFKPGDSFRADFGGLLSSKNNDTIRIRIKAGSVVLADSGPQTMQTAVDDVWQLSANFTIRATGSAGTGSIVTLGVFHSTKQSNGSQTGFAFNTVNSSSFDTTTLNTLNVTAEFSSNSPLNSIYSDIFILNKIY
jgi:hypothetical protein